MFGPSILCVGSATVDTFLSVSKPFSAVRSGDKVLVESVERYSGGGATNAAAAFAKLKIRARMLTKVGDDPDAEFIRREMKQYGVRNICLHHSIKHTDFSTILSSTEEKDRVVFVHKGASEDLKTSDYRKFQLRADWIYLASLTGESFQTAQVIARYAQENDRLLVFNPSLYVAERGKTALQPILRATTLLVLNKEEAQAILQTNSGDVPVLVQALQKIGPTAVVITDGSERLYALFHGTRYSFLPPKVKVVETTGAGDAFTAGLVAGLMKQQAIEDALRLGQMNALSVIQHRGAKNKLLTEREATVLAQKYPFTIQKEKI